MAPWNFCVVLLEHREKHHCVVILDQPTLIHLISCRRLSSPFSFSDLLMTNLLTGGGSSARVGCWHIFILQVTPKEPSLMILSKAKRFSFTLSKFSRRYLTCAIASSDTLSWPGIRAGVVLAASLMFSDGIFIP